MFFEPRKARSVHRVCSTAVNGWGRSRKARRLWFISPVRHVWGRQSDNLVGSVGPPFSGQFLNKGVPTIEADVVFLVFNYSLRTIPNFIAQIASIYHHDTYFSFRYYCPFCIRRKLAVPTALTATRYISVSLIEPGEGFERFVCWLEELSIAASEAARTASARQRQWQRSTSITTPAAGCRRCANELLNFGSARIGYRARTLEVILAR
jgi:hypothetical protein